MIHVEGMQQIDDALVRQDYELAVGAITEWKHRFDHEVAQEIAHGWSYLRFWKLPPLPASENWE